MDCQARHKRQLDFAFNASFASLNAAKVFIKDNGMDNSMAKVKSLMFNANYTKLLFDMSRCRPNRTLISRVVKELIGWQPKAAQPYTQILTNYCYYSNVFLTRTGFVIPNATFSFANRLPLLLHLLLRGVIPSNMGLELFCYQLCKGCLTRWLITGCKVTTKGYTNQTFC